MTIKKISNVEVAELVMIVRESSSPRADVEYHFEFCKSAVSYLYEHYDEAMKVRFIEQLVRLSSAVG